jgi:60 kDa SS-A/Ro ribonucleoprotein
MKVNKKKVSSETTHGGSKAVNINVVQQLRRSIMSCLLWEDTFYEDGVSIAQRISELIPKVSPEKVAEMAIEAREKMKLRHVPLLIVREMARLEKHKFLVGKTLEKVIQRADELTEFLAIYWKDGKEKLSSQVKKGLAAAFPKFSAYNLAKYNRDGAVKLRDVLFLCHAKPKNKEQEKVWKDLIDGKLPVPDTWEVALSGGADKKKTWERLIQEENLGALAFIRNLRNMKEAAVSPTIIRNGFSKIDTGRVLPFRFIAAAVHAPEWEPELEKAMIKGMGIQEKLPGKTVLILDVSGSMNGRLSGRSEMDRMDAAASLAMIMREACEDVSIYATAGNDGTMIHASALLPARRGFALRDAFRNAATKLGGGGIFLKQVMDYTYEKEKTADRVVVFTDEQDCDRKCNPSNAKTWADRNYLINVSTNKNGIGYGKWVHIDGWSEHIVEYIRELEQFETSNK